MRIETNVKVSAFELQMAQNPEDIINYAKQMNNQKVCEKIVELLKDKKPLTMYLELDGKLIHHDDSDDCAICTIALCQKVNYSNDYYVICKRDNRRMSPYDFCSLSTDDELYHPYGVGVIHKWEEER